MTAVAAAAAAVPQAILKLHPEWVASNIWEFPRIHMSYTPQVCPWETCCCFQEAVHVWQSAVDTAYGLPRRQTCVCWEDYVCECLTQLTSHAGQGAPEGAAGCQACGWPSRPPPAHPQGPHEGRLPPRCLESLPAGTGGLRFEPGFGPWLVTGFWQGLGLGLGRGLPPRCLEGYPAETAGPGLGPGFRVRV